MSDNIQLIGYVARWVLAICWFISFVMYVKTFFDVIKENKPKDGAK